MKNSEKYKYGMEELNRWMRHIDGSLWQTSSILVVGTSYVVDKVIKLEKDSGLVLFWSLLMLILWIFYLHFIKDIALKSQYYLKKINEFEDKFGVDILPNSKNDFTKENKLDRNIHSNLSAFSMDNFLLNKKNFFDFVLLVSFLVIIFWIIIISIFVYLNLDTIKHFFESFFNF